MSLPLSLAQMQDDLLGFLLGENFLGALQVKFDQSTQNDGLEIREAINMSHACIHIHGYIHTWSTMHSKLILAHTIQKSDESEPHTHRNTHIDTYIHMTSNLLKNSHLYVHSKTKITHALTNHTCSHDSNHTCI